jgi:hypothetical protein
VDREADCLPDGPLGCAWSNVESMHQEPGTRFIGQRESCALAKVFHAAQVDALIVAGVQGMNKLRCTRTDAVNDVKDHCDARHHVN